MTRTPEEVLEEVMEESPYNANFALSRPWILEAMQRYADEQNQDLIAERDDLKIEIEDMRTFPKG